MNNSKNTGQSGREPSALWLWLVPDLKKFRPMEQAKALAIAKSASLKTVEFIGIIIWLLIVTLITKSVLTQGNMSEDATSTLVVNLIVTVPLLLFVFVPIHIRRLRRGISEQLQQKDKR